MFIKQTEYSDNIRRWTVQQDAPGGGIYKSHPGRSQLPEFLRKQKKPLSP
nr:MAG TPA: hypothetical protein [Caudoviricetes sp.]